jgi:hypothetical protein
MPIAMPEKWQRFELWIPGDTNASLSFYAFAEPPIKTLSRLAAFKSPTNGGRPDVTRQYNHLFFTWQITTKITPVNFLRFQKLIKTLDELALHPTQQFAVLKDYVIPTSLTIRPDLSSSILSQFTDSTAPDLNSLLYTAHNVVITEFSYEGYAGYSKNETVGLTLTIQEVV